MALNSINWPPSNRAAGTCAFTDDVATVIQTIDASWD